MRHKLLACLLTLVLLGWLFPASVFTAALPEGVPDKLDAPAIEKIEVKTNENGIPYFQLELKIPESVMDLESKRPTDGFTWIEYYWKIDDGKWELVDGGHIEDIIDAGNAVSGKVNTYNDIFNPIDEGSNETIEIKNHTYTLKAMLFYQYYYGEESNESDFVSSQFSNEKSIGSGSFYSKAADWAKPELQKASDLGLIPDILIGADMTKPITREEFCELSVLLYEKVTDKASEPVSPNPFKDTTNPQILKAFKLGITTGTSTTTFSPKMLINREQCAAMLFRTIKAIKPDGSFSISGIKDFPDQKHISKWAVESTKYMSKIGIITGDTQGNFMPKAATTIQEAAGYGMATREQAIALTVRAYEKIPGI